MSQDKNVYHVGESVIIKPDTICPDYRNLSIGNWHGSVINTIQDESKVILYIEWDSITLNNMPEEFIIDSISNGLDFAKIYLNSDKVEATQPRDNIIDVNKTLINIYKKINYLKNKHIS
jgi:hypothetical protein